MHIHTGSQSLREGIPTQGLKVREVTTVVRRHKTADAGYDTSYTRHRVLLWKRQPGLQNAGSEVVVHFPVRKKLNKRIMQPGTPIRNYVNRWMVLIDPHLEGFRAGPSLSKQKSRTQTFY